MTITCSYVRRAQETVLDRMHMRSNTLHMAVSPGILYTVQVHNAYGGEPFLYINLFPLKKNLDCIWPVLTFFAQSCVYKWYCIVYL